MSTLRESVIVRTDYGSDLHGELYVGVDELPELDVTERNIYGAVLTPRRYRPATLPVAWTVCYHPGNKTDILLNTWRAISLMRQEIADAQREVESETPEPEDEHAGT